MRIAVEGCCHGELDKIYAALAHLEKVENVKVDLLICCGDFQGVRNARDLKCMSVPDKYKTLGTFHRYFSGERRAPVPTLFIGGNHEASNSSGSSTTAGSSRRTSITSGTAAWCGSATCASAA